MGRMEAIFLMIRQRKNDFFEKISMVVERFRVGVRLKILGSEDIFDWSPWLVEPSNGYVEVKETGPVHSSLIEWVEIRSVREERLGRLIPVKLIDCRQEIIIALNELGIDFEPTEGDEIKVYDGSVKQYP
jgi:hypothetical protein